METQSLAHQMQSPPGTAHAQAQRSQMREPITVIKSHLEHLAALPHYPSAIARQRSRIAATEKKIRSLIPRLEKLAMPLERRAFHELKIRPCEEKLQAHREKLEECQKKLGFYQSWLRHEPDLESKLRERIANLDLPMEQAEHFGPTELQIRNLKREYCRLHQEIAAIPHHLMSGVRELQWREELRETQTPDTDMAGGIAANLERAAARIHLHGVRQRILRERKRQLQKYHSRSKYQQELVTHLRELMARAGTNTSR